jgi:hypothetical protein
MSVYVVTVPPVQVAFGGEHAQAEHARLSLAPP